LKERTFALIKPDAYTDIGRIIDVIQRSGFTINKAKMAKLDEGVVALLYPSYATKAYFREITRFLMSDVVVGLELVGENAIETMKQVAGPENPQHAKQQ